MAYMDSYAYSSTELELENDFWNDFNELKTLSNVIRHFVQNFPSSDEVYKKSFARVIVENHIIGKKVSDRKLMELVDADLAKIDFSAPFVKNRNDPTQKLAEKLSVFKADMLDGNSFQDFVAMILEKNQFTDIEVMGRSGDQGGDLLATKDDKKIVIQAKRYSITSKVSNSAVQEAYGAIAYYDADSGAVITNTRYTNGAKELAKKTGIILWDRNDLMKFVANYNGEDDA